MTLPRTALLSALALCVGGGGTAFAQHTINWGGAVGYEDYQSDGDQLYDATFTFAIGTFGSGFTPGLGNASSWEGAWKELDRASLYNEVANFFTGSVVLSDNATFAVGEQAYLWVYNAEAGDSPATPNPVDPGPGAEWALFTNLNGTAWTIPDTLQTPATFDWGLSNADTAVFGGLEQHDPGGATIGELIGAGERSFVPGGQYEVQTYTFAPPVPEPRVALLAGLALALLGFRRRR